MWMNFLDVYIDPLHTLQPKFALSWFHWKYQLKKSYENYNLNSHPKLWVEIWKKKKLLNHHNILKIGFSLLRNWCLEPT